MPEPHPKVRRIECYVLSKAAGTRHYVILLLLRLERSVEFAFVMLFEKLFLLFNIAKLRQIHRLN